jgi:hypothetical protein
MSYIGNVVNVISANLSEDLDVSGQDIISSSNGNIEILPHGSGKVHIDGNGSTGGVVVSDGLIEIKTGTGSVGELRFYCESSNLHYTSLKSAAHGTYSGNVVLTLPSSDGNSGEYLKTDGSGVLSWDTPSTSGNAFTTIAVSGQSDVVADSSSDTLTLVAGSNITLTTNASGDSITIASSGGGGGGGSTGNISFSNSNISTNDQTMSFYVDDNDDDAGNDTFNFYGGPTAQGRITFLIHDTANQTNQMWVTEQSSTSYYSKFVQYPDKSTFYCNEGGSPTGAYALFSNVSTGGDIRLGTTTNGRVCVTEEYGSTVYYKFPRATPNNGDVLTASDGSGTLSWSAPSGGGGGGSSQNLFNTIAVSGQSDVVADSTTDTLTLVAGSNITLTTDASTDSVTIAASGGGGGGGSSYTTIVIDETNANTAPQTNYSGYSGDGTIMIGSGGHSYGNYNVGIGFEAECQPYYGLPSMAKCVAVGYYAHADAYQSTAIGRQTTTAYGSNTATAVGASVDTSVAGGYGGAFATPMGGSNQQNDVIAIGRGAGASGNWSMAICCSDTVTVSHDFSIYITTRKDGVFSAQSSTATSQISIGGSTHAIRFCESYTFPSSDGSAGQQLQTDGSGTLSWAAASSDIRLKKNVSDNDMGLDFINDLDTKIYNFRSYKELDKSDPQIAHYKPLEYGEDGHDGATETEDDIPKNLANKKGWQRGLIAQEVKATLDKYGHENFKGWGEDKHGVQEIYLEQFIVPLIKAVQELSEEVENLKAER